MMLSYYKELLKKAPKLFFPLEKKEVLKDLKAGDFVLISGWIFCARDETHKKILSSLKEGTFPFDFTNQAIYYVGPTKAQPGKIVGSFGPTTSGRMDPYMETFLKLGISATIGKGKRSPKVRELLKKYRAIYLSTFGGAGAFLSKFVKKIETLAFEELGPQALFRVKVENFPAIVINSIYGDDFFEGILKNE